MRVPIPQLDAFTTRRFAGHPAAVVVLDGFPGDLEGHIEFDHPS